jgi:hypothetical protein
MERECNVAEAHQQHWELSRRGKNGLLRTICQEIENGAGRITYGTAHLKLFAGRVGDNGGPWTKK